MKQSLFDSETELPVPEGNEIFKKIEEDLRSILDKYTLDYKCRDIQSIMIQAIMLLGSERIVRSAIKNKRSKQ